MKGITEVSETAGPRFELALERLRGGLGFSFNGVWFRLQSPNLLFCEALDQGSLQPTEGAARAHIERARQTLARLREASREVDELAQRYELRFGVIQDFGNGSIEVCRETTAR